MAVFERTTRERSSLFTPSLFHCWFIDPTKIPSDLCPPSSLLITPSPIGERSILMSARSCVCLSAIISSELNVRSSLIFLCMLPVAGWLGSRVVSVLDSGAEGPGSNHSRDAIG